MKKKLLYVISILTLIGSQFTSVFAQQKDCTKDGVIYKHGWNKVFYSQPTTTYPQTCDKISTTFSCNNGLFVGNFNGYPFEACIENEPIGCNIGNTHISHNEFFIGYSEQQVEYPKTCEQVSAKLSCENGNIIGNWQVFKYLGCKEIGGLVDGIDLVLNINNPGGNTIAQYSSPALKATIKNMGKSLISATNLKKGFLTCYREMDKGERLIIYQSEAIKELTINPGTATNQNIQLKDIFSQSLGDKKIECGLSTLKGETNTENNVWKGVLSVIKAERFDLAMNRAIDNIKDHIDAPEISLGEDGIRNFIINKVMNVLVPLVITLGILIAIIGFYKLLFSSDEKALGDGVKYITYGLIGIIVIMSAKFISNVLYSDIFKEGILGHGSIQGHEMAQNIYEKIMFPFIKMAIYLALGVLFVILASRTITFIFGDSSETKKKAGTIIARNVVGMLIIIAAKQVVEFIYGKQEDIVKGVNNLGEIGGGLLRNKNLPILYEIINWIMGLASLVILTMVLVQAFQLLLKPDAPDAMKKIKNSLLYIFIGIIIIGTGYIITNFLIIN